MPSNQSINKELLKHLCQLQKDRLAYADNVVNDLVKVALIAEQYVNKLKSKSGASEAETKEWEQIVSQVKERFINPPVQPDVKKSESIENLEELPTEDKALQSVGNTDKLKEDDKKPLTTEDKTA